MADDIKVVADFSDLQLMRRELVGISKDAKSSASVFEREFAKVERQLVNQERAFRRSAGASQSFYNELLGVSRATKSASSSASVFEKELGKVEKATIRATKAQNNFSNTSRKGMRRVEVVAQQAGYQFGDLAIQIQGGTNAAVALGQQGSQLLGVFGPAGALAGAALAISTAFIAPLLNAKKEVKALRKEFDELLSSIKKSNEVRGAGGEVALKTAQATKELMEVQAKISRIEEAAARRLKGREEGDYADNIRRLLEITKIQNKADYDKRAALILQLRLLDDQKKAQEALAGDQALEAENLRANEQRYRDERIAAEAKEKALDAAGDKAILDARAKAERELFKQNADYEKEMAREAAATKKKEAQLDAAGDRAILEAQAQAEIDLFNANDKYQKEQRAKDIAEAERNLDILFRSRTVSFSIRFAGEEAVMAQGFGGPTKTKMTYEELSAAGVAESNILGMGVNKPLPRGGVGGGGGGKSPTEEFKEYLDGLKQQAELEKQLVGLFDEKRAEEEAVIKARQKYGEVFGATQEAELRGTLRQIEADKERQRVLEEANAQTQSIADTLQSSMSDAFMSMVDGTKSFKDAMKDMARAVIKQLFDILVVQRLVGSFDAASGTGSGFVGAIMGIFQADGGAWQGGSQIKAYANGGVVGGPTTFPMAGGKTGLMGEAGPEAIMPLKRGANGKLGVQMEGNAGGDVNIVQNFSFAANGDDSVKKLIAQAAPQIANMTQKQIMDSRRRGGAMKSTFG